MEDEDEDEWKNQNVGVSLNEHLKENEDGEVEVLTEEQAKQYGILLQEELAESEWLYCLKEGRKWSMRRPKFLWTGRLRMHRVSPYRMVPESIPKPDYALDGFPTSEVGAEVNAKKGEVPIKSKEEIEGMREACKVAREVLDSATRMIKEGVTTDELDRVVHDTCIELGAYPSPLNYYNFPKSVCSSVNEVVCHGIPDRRELEDGDIVNLDVTCFYKGFHGDLNETHCVGKVSEKHKKLVRTAHECMEKAIAMVRPGVRFRDLGTPISQHAKANGFSVVRDYCGHGIGNLFHCAPTIPHYEKNKTPGTMRAGMTFTIEPMINEGSKHCVTWPDGWTAVTRDGKRSAQFEQTLLCTENGCEILTARTPNSTPLWWHE
ncbi:methionine aminopeptidase [Chloropicon primus]|uniref:Methionine aminopeptidase n=1 Tax=Chloropicon primus TaxID=1764295 RepID=A0A5B8MR98_9CHLO|nr:methionine aminopeptidase [Chloropicon primus]UPR02313.1 methionine aminopeptidase [Chloropicon primus]|eukprot:QDZ23099.1 methionine aminopeptidase [Chloropicon primus]